MKKARPQPAPSPSLHLSINRCPFCHDAVHVEGAWLACAHCLGRHHAACWTESEACAACGHDACLQRAERRHQGARNPLVGALALGLFVAGGFIAAISDGPPEAPPAEQAPPAAARPTPVTLGAEFSDAFAASGAIVGKVYVGGPAHVAGLETGQVVQSVDGQPVRDTHELFTALASSAPGETVRLGVRIEPSRLHHEPEDVDLCLVAAVPESSANESDSREAVFKALGLRVTTMTYGGVYVRQAVTGGSPDDAGAFIVVDEALAGAPAAPKVAENDWIESVDGRPVRTTRQLHRVLSGLPPGATVRLGLRHPFGEGSVVAVTLPR